MSGQGTMALEFLEQVRELTAHTHEGGPVVDAVVVPVGGGGMVSGVATVVKVWLLVLALCYSLLTNRPASRSIPASRCSQRNPRRVMTPLGRRKQAR